MNVVEQAAKLTLPVIVRVNGCKTPWFEADLAAIRSLTTAAVMLPKTESAEDVVLTTLIVGMNLPVVGLVESALGLARLSEILAAPNLRFLAFGSIDFALDLGCAHSRAALIAARSEIVWRSRAAAKPAPLHGVTVRVDVPLAALRDARHAAALGFGGKLAIHPNQLEPIVSAFRPSAERVLAAASEGSATRVAGEMIDAPVAARAREVLRHRTER
jgi:citrate lyase subunit beta/citryl-CoA lyase